MRRMFGWTATLALATTLTLVGCSDLQGPTAPLIENSVKPFFSYEPAPGFDVVRRTEPLATDLSVSEVIGPNGGTLQIAAAGVSLVVPPLALAADVEITMTALAGDAVAFEFAPHGLYFHTPPEIRVAVEGTHAESWWFWSWLSANWADTWMEETIPLGEFLGVYFEGDPQDGEGVDPIEQIPAYLQGGEVVFPIRHFSGYACASG